MAGERGDVMQGSRTGPISRPQPVPVYVAYFTAKPDGNGGIRYFPDIYGYDTASPSPIGADAPATRAGGRSGIVRMVEARGE